MRKVEIKHISLLAKNDEGIRDDTRPHYTYASEEETAAEVQAFIDEQTTKADERKGSVAFSFLGMNPFRMLAIAEHNFEIL